MQSAGVMAVIIAKNYKLALEIFISYQQIVTKVIQNKIRIGELYKNRKINKTCFILFETSAKFNIPIIRLVKNSFTAFVLFVETIK